MSDINFTIGKTVRVSTYGNSNSPKYIWFVLHGYGQLSPYFIKNFHCLDEKDHFVVAPEGLHRFYLNGLSGRVGASWMTKEERLIDISDYVTYLNEVFAKLVKPRLSDNSTLIPFGFSQGVATLSRWMAALEAPPKRAIFWAGSFPPDLEPKIIESSIKPVEVICAVGSQDEYINESAIKNAQDHFSKMGVSAKLFEFEGGHKIPKDALITLFEKFIQN